MRALPARLLRPRRCRYLHSLRRGSLQRVRGRHFLCHLPRLHPRPLQRRVFRLLHPLRRRLLHPRCKLLAVFPLPFRLFLPRGLRAALPLPRKHFWRAARRHLKRYRLRPVCRRLLLCPGLLAVHPQRRAQLRRGHLHRCQQHALAVQPLRRGNLRPARRHLRGGLHCVRKRHLCRRRRVLLPALPRGRFLPRGA